MSSVRHAAVIPASLAAPTRRDIAHASNRSFCSTVPGVSSTPDAHVSAKRQGQSENPTLPKQSRWSSAHWGRVGEKLSSVWTRWFRQSELHGARRHSRTVNAKTQLRTPLTVWNTAANLTPAGLRARLRFKILSQAIQLDIWAKVSRVRVRECVQVSCATRPISFGL